MHGRTRWPLRVRWQLCAVLNTGSAVLKHRLRVQACLRQVGDGWVSSHSLKNPALCLNTPVVVCPSCSPKSPCSLEIDWKEGRDLLQQVLEEVGQIETASCRRCQTKRRAGWHASLATGAARGIQIAFKEVGRPFRDCGWKTSSC